MHYALIMENYVKQMAASGQSAAVNSLEIIFDDFFVSFGNYLGYHIVFRCLEHIAGLLI